MKPLALFIVLRKNSKKELLFMLTHDLHEKIKQYISIYAELKSKLKWKVKNDKSGNFGRMGRRRGGDD